jgi:hypothetical protein
MTAKAHIGSSTAIDLASIATTSGEFADLASAEHKRSLAATGFWLKSRTAPASKSSRLDSSCRKVCGAACSVAAKTKNGLELEMGERWCVRETADRKAKLSLGVAVLNMTAIRYGFIGYCPGQARPNRKEKSDGTAASVLPEGPPDEPARLGERAASHSLYCYTVRRCR